MSTSALTFCYIHSYLRRAPTSPFQPAAGEALRGRSGRDPGGGATRLWVDCVDDDPPAWLIGDLRDGGINTYPAERPPSGPGILYCAGDVDPTCDYLDTIARRGGRVLAVVDTVQTLTPQTARRLISSGASDVFGWRDLDDPVSTLQSRFERWDAVENLLRSERVSRFVVGGAPAWTRVLRDIVEVAAFTRAALLLTGETGTGKEMVARLIHELDPRPDKADLVIVDCTTIVESLSGSEFFGHEKGAFTGAVGAREGAFALADGGTLFLDEVGDLPPALQAELLRVIQEGTFKRVGSNVWQRTSFRLICASNKDLVSEQRAGRFRADLYYRIAASTYELPPLRYRLQDVGVLAERFLDDLSDGEAPGLDEPVLRFLEGRAYPGNVRDLRQMVGRLLARWIPPGPITVGQVPEEEWGPGDGAEPELLREAIGAAVARGLSLRDITGAAKELAVQAAIERENGSLKQAARRLRVTDRTLQLARAKKEARIERSGSDAES